MSKRQTRRGVSLTRELYERLFAFARERQIPAAQVVAQGVEAVLRGDLPLAPAADPIALAKATAAQRVDQPLVWRRDRDKPDEQPADAPAPAGDDWGTV